MARKSKKSDGSDAIKAETDAQSDPKKNLEIYRKIVAKVWEDGIMTADERDFLELMREKMGIKDDVHIDMERDVLSKERTLHHSLAILEESTNPLEREYRRRFPLKYRTLDGHIVRTEVERAVDDMLFENGIIHTYQSTPIDERGEWMCDFYLPEHNIYIEVWDVAENELFEDRKNAKLEVYTKNKEATPVNINEPNALGALSKILKPLLDEK